MTVSDPDYKRYKVIYSGYPIIDEFKEIEFNTTPNLVYTIYCNSTIEAKSIAATKETPIYKVINETEKEILYDEESGDIIL